MVIRPTYSYGHKEMVPQVSSEGKDFRKAGYGLQD